MSDVRLDYAMLALNADVASSGKLHLFGAGFDTLEVASIPSTVPPFALVLKLASRSGIGLKHNIGVMGLRIDGEKTKLADISVEFPQLRHADQEETYAAVVIHVGLNITRPGKFQFIIESDGSDIGSIPLWIVDISGSGSEKTHA